MSITERVHRAVLEHERKYGDRIQPWYIVLGKTEVKELALEANSRPSFGFQGNERKTPNRFFSHIGEHRIVAVPFETHFSLGYDPDVANYFDQMTPYWSSK